MGDTPTLPGIAAAMDGILRDLRGDVRVVVVNAVHRLSAPVDHKVDHKTSHEIEHRADREVGHQTGPTAGPSTGGAATGRNLATWSRVARRLSERPDLLSIAVSAGPTTGPGLALALACDLRVLTEDASLCLTEATAGRVPGLGVAGTLVDTVGYARALALCLTGRPVGARDALRLGLAALVVPRRDLDAEVGRLVDRLLAVPPDVSAETKALLAGARERSGIQRRAAEDDALARVLATTAGNAG
ncbi:enoyl-CoA hydratase/isomerase family protein [Frankia sp. Mgl5]|uniref:enoyl-CoA hydratase/isomerase family protein n=1 Tax=Frankia sp. Mgl5 TaxID=2933793 RepID=UPI00200D6BE1|nr:enoyl-CoA hydratase/isomerase family protein [Frankia sp. Mgl5]MCK9930169.1 enoyl-CoA hydratase/isomerase family protein [Frankia sp. Mgl5]